MPDECVWVFNIHKKRKVNDFEYNLDAFKQLTGFLYISNEFFDHLLNLWNNINIAVIFVVNYIEIFLNNIKIFIRIYKRNIKNTSLLECFLLKYFCLKTIIYTKQISTLSFPHMFLSNKANTISIWYRSFLILIIL